MKSIKLLLLFVAFALPTFYSCSDSDPIENSIDTQESVALRTMIHELKKANNITGRSANDNNPFCFDFVYPVTFSYTNDVSIVAETFAGLIEIISNETPAIYLSSVQFPFQVQHQGAVETINSEAEFHALLVECGFNTFNDDLSESFCFDIIFPIEIVTSNQDIITVSNLAQLNAEIGNTTATSVAIVFPINVLYNNQTVIVDNLFEFYQMVANCSECICTQEYAPVCVQTATGIMEFGNMCYAICAGYTQNDLVNCNPTGCEISNLEVTVGDCNADGTYQVTIDFDYTNPTDSQFEIRNSSNQLIGTFQLESLPVTLSNFAGNGQDTDFLTVRIVGSTVCVETKYWLSPDCGCGCSTEFAPVCVMTATGIVQYDNACQAICAGHSQNDFVSCGTATYNFGQSLIDGCFDMIYPVGVQHQGMVVTVTVDGQLLQYWNPTVSPMPVFNYPVSAIFDGTTYIFNNQQEFEAQIIASCQ